MDLQQLRIFTRVASLGSFTLAAELGTQNATWEYREGDVVRQLPMHCSIVVNSADTYQAACLAGLGLIQMPLHGTQHLIDSGQLVAVMPEFTAAPMPMSLLYPNRRQLAPRVMAMLGWITEVVGHYLVSV